MGEIIILSLLAIIILSGFIGNLIFRRTNIPSIIWLLILGLLFGQIFGFVNRETLISMTGIIGTIAIITILSEGGMSFDIKKIILDAPKGFLLMIIGLIFSIGVTMAIMLSFGFSFELSLFTGLTLGGTSASVIIPIIVKMEGLSDKVKSILSLESIADTFTIVMALILLDMMTGKIPDVSIGSLVNPVLSGIAIGVGMGVSWIFLLKKIEKVEYNYAATLAVLIMTYVVAELIDASGALACFFAGLTMGNYELLFSFMNTKSKNMPEFETSKYHSLVTFFVRTFYFVFLGAIVLISNYLGLLIGILICLGFLFVRFFYVRLITSNDKGITKFDRQTMTVMFPRGLSAAVLATIPLALGIENSSIIVDIVFSVIIGTILISTIGMYFVMKGHKKRNDKKEKAKEDD